MDDLKKRKLKNIDKVVSKVTGDFQEGFSRLNLDKLYQRKSRLEYLLTDPKKGAITKANYKLQLKDLDIQIRELSTKIDLNRDIDLEIDEESARDFLKDNPDLFCASEDAMVASNDALDKLEEELYGRKS